MTNNIVISKSELLLKNTGSYNEGAEYRRIGRGIGKVKVDKVNTYIMKGKKRAYVKFAKEFPAIDIATNLGLM